MADGGDDLARALLVHARGNSGVIASQLVRGWADVLTVRGRGAGAGVGAAVVAKALRRGDELAWAAVTDPVEGTVLSVSRAAADAAERAAADGDDLHGVVLARRRRGRAGPGPHARPSCPPSPRPAWSTPGAPGCCWRCTPCATWSRAGEAAADEPRDEAPGGRPARPVGAGGRPGPTSTRRARRTR